VNKKCPLSALVGLLLVSACSAKGSGGLDSGADTAVLDSGVESQVNPNETGNAPDGADSGGPDEGDEDVDVDVDIDGGPTEDEPETDCDGLDGDGDGVIDDGFDLDGDGYTECGDEDTAPDCKDDDADVHPGAEDVQDGVDNDCDRYIDEDAWRAGDLVITEVMVNPDAVSDAFGEWFEVRNTTDRSLILNSVEIWSAAEQHTVAGPVRLTLEPGALFVFGASDNVTRNGGVSVGYAYRDVGLDDEVDALSLLIDELVIDAVQWNVTREWPAVVGASLNLDPSFVDDVFNDLPLYWCSANLPWAEGSDLGTPGQENAMCEGFDHDGDGVSIVDGDCDDADPHVFPGADEIDAGVDNDCDGVVAAMPVAWADYDTSATLSSCDTLQLDGTRSIDLDGDLLSYSWTVDAVPEGSVATTETLVSSTDVRPVFAPDLAGAYTFSLVVNDGVYDSTPSRLSLSIADPEPLTVTAGADQSDEQAVICDVETGIPGDASCPMCEDVTFVLPGEIDGIPPVTDFSWEIVSDWGGVTLEDPTASEAHITVSGLHPYMATETASASVEATLRVTDCMGRSTSASVTLAVSCTGEAPVEADTGVLDTGL
jgi:hypothetical protein